MTQHEENTSNMYDDVRDTMDSEKETYSGIPAIAEDQEELKTATAKLSKDNKAYNAACKGSTKEKHNAIDAAIRLVMPIKSSLYSLGSKNPRNEKLKEETKISEYALGRLSEIEFKSTVNTILDEARANTAAISVSHKITEDVIAAAQTAVDAVFEKAGVQDSSFNTRKALRKELDKDFDDINELLKERYDNDIELLRKDHIGVYNKYWAARVIKDLGGSHSGADDGVDETPLDNPPTPPVQ